MILWSDWWIFSIWDMIFYFSCKRIFEDTNPRIVTIEKIIEHLTEIILTWKSSRIPCEEQWILIRNKIITLSIKYSIRSLSKLIRSVQQKRRRSRQALLLYLDMFPNCHFDELWKLFHQSINDFKFFISQCHRERHILCEYIFVIGVARELNRALWLWYIPNICANIVSESWSNYKQLFSFVVTTKNLPCSITILSGLWDNFIDPSIKNRCVQ